MSQKNKGFFLYLFSCSVFLFQSFTSFCLARNLEIPLPGMPGGAGTAPELPEYLHYMFNFGVSLGFLAVLASLIIAGAFYVFATTNPSLKERAKDHITGAISGLIILVSVYLIITTINPELKIFQIRGELVQVPITQQPIPTQTGVYLYMEIGCIIPENTSPPIYTGPVPNLGDYINRVKSLKIVDDQSQDLLYFVILHDLINLRGGCEYFSYPSACQPTKPLAASASIYKWNSSPSNGGVTFYREPSPNPPSYNRAGGYFTVTSSDIAAALGDSAAYQADLNGLEFKDGDKCTVPEEKQDCIKWEKDGKTCKKENRRCPKLAGKNINSIEIVGNYIVVLLYWGPAAEESPYKWAFCQTFPTPDDVNKDGPRQIKWEYIQNQTNLPDLVLIFPVKEK